MDVLECSNQEDLKACCLRGWDMIETWATKLNDGIMVIET
jgi:hypothetical protein